MQPFDGKVALVTGAASGIGRATALCFARAGANVAVSDIDLAGCEETAQMVQALGRATVSVRVDVSIPESVQALVGEVVARMGRLDCAFNGAGVEGILAPLADLEEDAWDRVIDTNLKGVWLCMKYQIRQMLTQGGGAIVNASSVAGLVGAAALPAYVASKHGVVGLTKSAALAYAQQGVRVNAVCPAFIDTPMVGRIFAGQPERQAAMIGRHPIGRLGRAEEVAQAAVWLCSGEASFVTGSAMTVDGGYVAQ
jgi:NAD(P)-dependent dehydrogenase (short-subunit alcohol dehydrogenase family)